MCQFIRRRKKGACNSSTEEQQRCPTYPMKGSSEPSNAKKFANYSQQFFRKYLIFSYTVVNFVFLCLLLKVVKYKI